MRRIDKRRIEDDKQGNKLDAGRSLSIGVFAVLIATGALWHFGVTGQNDGRLYAGDEGGTGGTVLDAEFDENGLSNITVDGLQLLENGIPEVHNVVVTDQYRDKRKEAQKALMLEGPEEAPYIDDRSFENASTELVDQNFDPDAKRLTQQYEWGSIHTDYSMDSNRLNTEITVENESDQVIESIELSLLRLDLGAEADFDDSVRDNISRPTVLKAEGNESMVLLANDQPDKPLRLQWNYQDGELEVRLRSGHPEGGAEPYDGVWNVRPVDSGESDRYEISLRFADADADSLEVARDVYDGFHEAFPQLLEWNDRRPIGTLFFAGYHDATPENPRRYTVGGFPEDMDVETDEGREKLRESLLNYADRVINRAEDMGLQGVIVWDIEGSEFPHPITYLGDPRFLPFVAPEMDAVVDDFFEKLNEAGLPHGVTIRPTLLRPKDEEGNIIPDIENWADYEEVDHGPWLGHDWSEAYEAYEPIASEEQHSILTRLDKKTRYAKDRWGASIIYVDTPHIWRPRERTDGLDGWDSRHLGAPVWEELTRRHPDVLFIPEHSYPRYWASTAPYYQIGYSPLITPPEIRATYPEGFVAQMMANEPGVVDDNVDTFVDGVVDGDTFLVHGWWGGQEDQVDEVFGNAAEMAPFKLRITPETITVGETELPDTEALREHIEGEIDAEAPLPERRFFIQYTEDVERPRVNEIIEVITEADGVIAWTQVD